MRLHGSIGYRAVVALLAVTAVAPVHGQVARSGGSSNANAQLMQQMQQLASERTSLQAENARMKKELEGLRKERDDLKKAQQGLDLRARQATAALAQSTARDESTADELKRTKQRTEELIGKFRETVQNLKTIETEATSTKQTLATRDRELKVCVDRNLALYNVNLEILSRLEHQPVWSRVAAAEPFTQIKRVQLENLVDDYKARAAEQRVTPPASNTNSSLPPK